MNKINILSNNNNDISYFSNNQFEDYEPRNFFENSQNEFENSIKNHEKRTLKNPFEITSNENSKRNNIIKKDNIPNKFDNLTTFENLTNFKDPFNPSDNIKNHKCHNLENLCTIPNRINYFQKKEESKNQEINQRKIIDRKNTYIADYNEGKEYKTYKKNYSYRDDFDKDREKFFFKRIDDEYNQYINSIYNVNRKNKKRKDLSIDLDDDYKDKFEQKKENNNFNIYTNNRINKKNQTNYSLNEPIDEGFTTANIMIKKNKNFHNDETKYDRYKSSTYHSNSTRNHQETSKNLIYLRKIDNLTPHEVEKKEELEKNLKGFDKKLIDLIESELLTKSPDVKWDDIAGLDFAKKTIKEIIIWPMLRPDIFIGIRKPPKGLLLFGPPGTGKTMIAKAIASESKSRFFNISASSLMSKWIGESERLVRTLFALASFYQPSIVFIDEIDSILTSRSENENEASRRIKTEFLVQLDGAGTNQEDRILIIGATNRPQEIDEAFIRRLSKRLYIPLPNKASRIQFIQNVIKKEKESNNKYSVNESEFEEILNITRGFSGSDLIGLCREAAMMPIRNIDDILNVNLENIGDISLQDFKSAVQLVKPSVSEKSIKQYIEWNKNFGSFIIDDQDE